MAITNSNQKWQIGEMVKVGFMRLMVTGLIPTPGDYRPDVYELVSQAGIRYQFTPHYGLERVSS